MYTMCPLYIYIYIYIYIWSGFLDLCSILLKSSHHEAGLSRKRFYGLDV